MKKSRITALPLIVVVAVVALVVGTFGTAQAAGLTVKQVKKIAAKVVDKKASGLSVAHAQTATNATNAANAATVGGFLPNGLVRATGVSTDGAIGSFDTSTFTDITSKSVTAPSAGILVITATYEFNRLAGNPNEAVLESRTALDGAAASAAIAGSDNHPSGVNASSSVNSAIAVTAGTHTVSLQLREFTSGAVFVAGRNLSVVFVPFGNAGAVGSLGRPDSGAENR